ncbi:MAG TPA: hypothetical protein VFM55_04450 [Micromonosporaceae bacterium]|nr:hypothetical protein [Micromonosporaceae bacterium]
MSLVVLLSVLAAAVAAGSTAAYAANPWGYFLADEDSHYAVECGAFWPTSNTFTTYTDGYNFRMSWTFRLTLSQLIALQCVESRYNARFLELDFRLVDFEGDSGWNGYTVTSTNLPDAVRDEGFSDPAADATPGVTGTSVVSLLPDKTYTTEIAWSNASGIHPRAGGSPRVTFQWVPSHWASGAWEQTSCVTHNGAPSWCIFGTARVYVSAGLRNGAQVPFSGSQSYTYPINLGAYADHIVQWDADIKTQKTAWLVSPDLKRLWIPDSGTYYCLKGRGLAGPDLLQAVVLDALPDQTNRWAACGDTLWTSRVLRRHMYLRSGDGRYLFILQGDGNLVLYGPSGRALWANSRSTTDYVIMQGDGNFVAYNSSGGATWATNTVGRGGVRILVQNDGNVVMYSSNAAVWATNTAGLT